MDARYEKYCPASRPPRVTYSADYGVTFWFAQRSTAMQCMVRIRSGRDTREGGLYIWLPGPGLPMPPAKPAYLASPVRQRGNATPKQWCHTVKIKLPGR